MTKTHVFIDTNIWLSFYAFTNDDIEQLKTLAALIANDQLALYMTDQVVDEFYRNRDNKLSDSIKSFSKERVAESIPRFMREYQEAIEYLKLQGELEKHKGALIAKAVDDAVARKLPADSLFSEILAACAPKEIKTLISKALDRRLRGNPPGKPQSLGDQIHWEALLRDVPEGADLHIVSKDGDFESALQKGTIHPFLFDEWMATKKSNLILHLEVKPFLNHKFPGIKLATDVEKKQAIEFLTKSSNFAWTHLAISKLKVFIDELSWNDAEAIFDAAEANSQISWIGTDDDVSSFYLPLVEKFSQKLGDDKAAKLAALFKKEAVNNAADDDVPF